MTQKDIVRAREWYKQHQMHVNRMLTFESRDYPPSGSDVHHPELWKIGHWKWFFANCEK